MPRTTPSASSAPKAASSCPTPWVPAREGGTVKIIVKKRKDKEPQEIAIETSEWLYGIEADTVAANVESRQAAFPAMSWDDTLGNMKMLDAWRQSFGFVYDAEKPEARTRTVHGRPLAVREDATMEYGSIEGVDKPVSRLVMGVRQPDLPPARGGHVGRLLRARRQCVRLAPTSTAAADARRRWASGSRTATSATRSSSSTRAPTRRMCFPDKLTEQLLISLDRLQMDYVDIYMMHRDNLDVPVGEFVDVLNEHKRAGRMLAFGVSNWTSDRVQAFNDYAARKGLTGFAAVSNNFSLARMVEAPWKGCLSSSDAESRAWFTKTQTPLMPWSSQARGFFTGRARPDDLSDSELVRCWYAEDNFRRQQRAQELAKKST